MRWRVFQKSPAHKKASVNYQPINTFVEDVDNELDALRLAHVATGIPLEDLKVAKTDTSIASTLNSVLEKKM